MRFIPLLILTILPAAQDDKSREREPAFAGVVYDVGGVDDKSFNASAHRGLMKAKKELGIEVEEFEPKEPADRKSGLQALCGKKVGLILGIGFMFSDDILATAKLHPEIKFACVDMNEGTEMPANLQALKFREEEGSFLVGALAGLLTKSKTVGFVGGMKCPLIEKFEAGFAAGIRHVAPEVKILVNYAGDKPSAFRDPDLGKKLTLAQYEDGADIVFHASGITGVGVFRAAKEKDKLAIGVDSDQYDEAPGHVLTSMIKNVDVAVYETIKSTKEGKFKGGTRFFGVAENGVGFVYDERNKKLIPEEIYKKVMAVRDDLAAGKIKAPTAPRK